MKYVKTKDGRIFEKEYLTYEELTNTWYYHGCFIDDGEAIAEADTIEELCDEFVLGKTKYHKPCVTKLPLDFLKECVATKTSYDLVVYGSIWVNDELHKVVKMNDKGELELL